MGGAWACGGVRVRIRASCEASAGVKAAAAGKAQGQVEMDEVRVCVWCVCVFCVPKGSCFSVSNRCALRIAGPSGIGTEDT
eukprot:41781-Eustigmatos_ZCMA.PRE.1